MPTDSALGAEDVAYITPQQSAIHQKEQIMSAHYVARHTIPESDIHADAVNAMVLGI